ncbi:MAG: B12-binding domain-containing radical SAM protein [Candidatus Omnitrophota bacterium]
MAAILLIYPQPDEIKQRRFGFSLNLLYLSSILKQAGHTITAYLDYSIERFDPNPLHPLLVSSEIVIIEFDAFPLKRSINIPHAETLVKRIKTEHPSKKIIVFGYDFSLFQRELEYADLTLPAEPEANILAAIDHVTGKNTEPFILRQLEHPDLLPFPDRSLLTPFAETGGAVDQEPHLAPSTLIETARGCPGNCIFCQRKGWQTRMRSHSVDYVVCEFTELQQKKYKNIWVTDDNFTFDLKRAKEILKRFTSSGVTQGMKIALSSWTHIDREFLRLARDAGVSIISFGVETAEPTILEFYQKKIDLEAFQRLISSADELGLYTVGNFILGAPMETEETIDKTFAYIMETPFDRINLKILDYMAGSQLYERLTPELRSSRRHVFACQENGLNEFPFQYLKQRINRFQNRFRLACETRLKRKMERFGPPYYSDFGF